MTLQNRQYVQRIQGLNEDHHTGGNPTGRKYGESTQRPTKAQLTEAMMVLNEKAARQPLLKNRVLNPDGLSQEEIQAKYHHEDDANQALIKALEVLK